MKREIVGGVLLALFLSGPALAKGVGEGDGEIGFDLGGTNFDSDVTEKSGATLAFRGGYHFTDLFELEGQAAISGANETAADVILTRTMVNAVFNLHPPRKTIVPYVLVGVGTVTLTFDTFLGEVDDTDVAYQGAVGSRFFFGRGGSVAFRVELSFLNEGTFDETSTHTNLVGGLTWTL